MNYVIQILFQYPLYHKQKLISYSNSNKYNADIDSSSVDKIAALTAEAKQFLLAAAKKLDLSARGYFKVIKVARTIADLESSLEITIPHVAESLQYRQIIPT